MRAPLGNFESEPAPEALEVLTAPVAAAIRDWQGPVPADELLYVDTDPEKADTAVFAETYGTELWESSANCVVVSAKQSGERRLAACLVPSPTRVDVNGTARRHLGARKVSFAPRETATSETGMEYGGITPVGLPADWPVLIDSAVTALPWVLMGSGARRGKLIVPGKALLGLPGATVLDGLGTDG